MTKMLSRIGILLCLGGVLLGAFAIAAYYSVPEDPTGAGASYDDSVKAYNKQVEELVDANPNLPTPAMGKTRLQTHKDDVKFWMVAAALLAAVGLAMYVLSHPKREQRAEREP